MESNNNTNCFQVKDAIKASIHFPFFSINTILLNEQTMENFSVTTGQDNSSDCKAQNTLLRAHHNGNPGKLKVKKSTNDKQHVSPRKPWQSHKCTQGLECGLRSVETTDTEK